MKKTLLISLLSIGGCAPLQQAPLVYSSKYVFGVDISTPSSESPGGSLSIGWKGVDAAYVPVAVSKEDEQKSHDVRVINATYGEGNRSEKNNDEQTQLKIKQLETAILNRSTKKSELEAYKALNIEIDQYNTLTASLLSITSEQPEKIKELKKETSALKDRIKSLSNETYIQNRTTLDLNEPLPDTVKTNNTKKQITLNEELTSADSEVKKRQQELAQELYVNQTDAMSVYGSFGGKFGTNTNGTSNDLGKMFSTGVAAQFLTKGFQAQAFMSECLKAAQLMTSAEKKELAASECLKIIQSH